MHVFAMLADMGVCLVWTCCCCCMQVGEDEKALNNGVNPFIQLIEDADGLDKIEHLQEHQNEDIYEKAVSTLETYFELEDGEVENLAPGLDANQATYAFGNGAAPGAPQGGFNFGNPM